MAEAAQNRFPFIVVATLTDSDEMRELFLAGALDVSTMPARAPEVVELIRRNFQRMQRKPQTMSLLLARAR